MPFLASQPTPSPPDPLHTTPRSTQHQPWKKLTPGAPGRGQACSQWPCSFLAWGPRVVHGWEKVPLALGPGPSARGHPGGRWRRRERKGRGISPGGKRGAGRRGWEPPTTCSRSPSTHTRTRTLRHKSTHGHTQTHLHTLTLTCAHPCAPYVHKDMHAYSYTRVTGTPSVWIHVEAPTCSHTHSFTYTWTHTRVRMAHARTHRGTHMYTHVYTVPCQWGPRAQV